MTRLAVFRAVLAAVFLWMAVVLLSPIVLGVLRGHNPNGAWQAMAQVCGAGIACLVAVGVLIRRDRRDHPLS